MELKELPIDPSSQEAQEAKEAKKRRSPEKKTNSSLNLGYCIIYKDGRAAVEKGDLI